MPTPTHRAGSAESPTSSDTRIIDATLELIADHGLGDITMSGIAAAAGVSRQTLYNHYPGPHAIVVEAVRRHNEHAIGLLEASMNVVRTPQDRLEQLVRHVVAVGAHAPHSPGLRDSLPPEARGSLEDYDQAVIHHLHTLIQHGRRSGAFRSDIVPAIDTQLTKQIVDGLARLAAERPADAARITTTGIRTVHAALGYDPD